MNRSPLSVTHAAALALCLAACAGPTLQEKAVMVTATAPNVVSYWNEVANQAVNAAPLATGTAEEQRPAYHVDLATVHVAMYDAVSAIDGRYKPFAVMPKAPAAGASIDAAASAAAYEVLRALFPGRAAVLQAAYDSRIATIAPGPARERGLALGREVAAAVVARRANDGRSVVLAPYVSDVAPGRFQSVGPTPLNRHVPFIRPFSLTRVDQFRPPPPPAPGSPVYEADLKESQAGGGSVSSVRSAQQLEIARFHTEPPGPYLTRNLGRFAASTADAADAARLMAFIYVVHADAINACFEAKYHYETWRPRTAFNTTAGGVPWTPVLPTPNHPEYPAAHSCTSGGLGETLRLFYGTRQVSYRFDSQVTGTTRSYADTDALNIESRTARVYGGMHFGFSTTAGVELGTRVAQWVGAHHFGPRE